MIFSNPVLTSSAISDRRERAWLNGMTSLAVMVTTGSSERTFQQLHIILHTTQSNINAVITYEPGSDRGRAQGGRLGVRAANCPRPAGPMTIGEGQDAIALPPGRRGLFELYLCRLDDLGPFGGFGAHERAEFFRSPRDRLQPLVGITLFYVRHAESACDLCVQAVDDVLRGARRDDDAVPAGRYHCRPAGFTHGLHVRQEHGSLRARHRDYPQAAVLNERHHHRQVAP